MPDIQKGQLYKHERYTILILGKSTRNRRAWKCFRAFTDKDSQHWNGTTLFLPSSFVYFEKLS